MPGCKRRVKKNLPPNSGSFLGVGGGCCLCHVSSIYRSLPCSILFLNFLYKRLREGKDESGAGRREKSAIMDFILNPSANLSNPPKKPTPVTKAANPPQKTHTLKRNLCPYFRGREGEDGLGGSHATLASSTWKLVGSEGDVRTARSSEEKVLKKVNRFGQKGDVFLAGPRERVSQLVTSKVARLMAKTMHLHNANKRISQANRVYLQMTLWKST